MITPREKKIIAFLCASCLMFTFLTVRYFSAYSTNNKYHVCHYEAGECPIYGCINYPFNKYEIYLENDSIRLYNGPRLVGVVPAQRDSYTGLDSLIFADNE